MADHVKNAKPSDVDVLDVIHEEITAQVRELIYEARRTLELIADKQQELGLTAVSIRGHETTVQVSEILTGTVLSVHNATDLISHITDGQPVQTIAEYQLHETARDLLPPGQYFCWGQAHANEAESTIRAELGETAAWDELQLYEPLAWLLKDLDLTSDKLAEFLGVDPGELRLARAYLAWISEDADTPTLPGSA